jgi:hypothetical protein
LRIRIARPDVVRLGAKAHAFEPSSGFDAGAARASSRLACAGEPLVDVARILIDQAVRLTSALVRGRGGEVRVDGRAAEPFRHLAARAE